MNGTRISVSDECALNESKSTMQWIFLCVLMRSNLKFYWDDNFIKEIDGLMYTQTDRELMSSSTIWTVEKLNIKVVAWEEIVWTWRSWHTYPLIRFSRSKAFRCYLLRPLTLFLILLAFPGRCKLKVSHFKVCVSSTEVQTPIWFIHVTSMWANSIRLKHMCTV